MGTTCLTEAFTWTYLHGVFTYLESLFLENKFAGTKNSTSQQLILKEHEKAFDLRGFSLPAATD
jgi:hypothetical protein